MKNQRLLLILTALIFLAFAMSSCDFIKGFITPQKEDEKPPGYIETKENELFIYDVLRNGIIITKYIGQDLNPSVPDSLDNKPVIAIGSLAFFDNNIIETIFLPATLLTIEASAFYHCNKLTQIRIPNTVKTIGERAFAWCNSLEEVVIPEGISVINDYAFNNCSSLTKVTLPKGLERIGKRAFSWCSSLVDITIPDTLKSIDNGAFRNCSSLENIYISSRTTNFGSGIFENCDELTIFTDQGSVCYDYCLDNDYNVSIKGSQLPDVSGVSDISDISDTD